MKTNQTPFFAFALSCLLFSCSNNESLDTASNATTAANSTYEVIAATNLPSSITTSIATSTTSKMVSTTASASEVNLVSNGTYTVYVSKKDGSKFKLSFTAKGKLVYKISQTPIAVSDLLTAITTYIANNYVGSTIISAHSESDGGFDVFIAAADGSKVKLNFAADGTFVSESVLKANGNHRHNHSSNHTPIAITDLAQSITAYIKTNYVGSTITSAHLESDGSFDVFITTAEGAKLNLNFSALGEFVSVSSDEIHHSDDGTMISVSNLASAITTYISTNYVGATIVGARQESDGSFEVHIITADSIKLELKFNAAGEFISLSSNTNNHYSHIEVAVAIQNLLANITTYISTNYAAATITSAHLDSDGTYDVIITTAAGVKLKLEFTATGVFKSVKNL